MGAGRRRTVLIVMPAMLAFFSGGYFDGPARRRRGAWVLWSCRGRVAPRPLPGSRRRAARSAGPAPALRVDGLSVGWAPIGVRAEDDLQRLLLYTGTSSQLWPSCAARGEALVEPALALGCM